MKNYLFIGVLLCLFQPAIAQRIVEKTFPSGKIKKVKLDLKMAQLITVTTWEQDEVYFKASIDLNNGKLDDSLKLSFEKNNDLLFISSKVDVKFNNWISKETFDKWQKENKPFYWDDKENFVVAELLYELKIPKNTILEIASINADVELRGVSSVAKVKTINGFVDMDWLEKAGADISLKTINGEVYSDMDISFPNFKKYPIVGYELQGKYKQGGTKLQLETINGDIFFRKAKN
ncbi:hypothetical protein R9C00_14525 [Flammeovirgaceae bacterium SG7u.111]|nr:hypothetical protein [Flammeovirgaceae bacterium SG7u.132]WPO38673.1 hypothetical protein R9C00_14525 [Flammeovirgaceae bacterium SG7u.111]